jgi:hypothetical protein
MLVKLYRDIRFAIPLVVKFFTFNLPFFIYRTWPNVLFNRMRVWYQGYLARIINYIADEIVHWGTACIAIRIGSDILSAYSDPFTLSLSGLICFSYLRKRIQDSEFHLSANQFIGQEVLLLVANTLLSEIIFFICLKWFLVFGTFIFGTLFQDKPLLMALTHNSLSLAYWQLFTPLLFTPVSGILGILSTSNRLSSVRCLAGSFSVLRDL